MNNDILRPLSSIFFIFTLTVLSCGKNDDEIISEPVPIDLTYNQVELIKAGNEFAFDVFRKVLENAGDDENIMISPISISFALSMTINGASGETRDAIMETLRLKGIKTDALNQSYKDLTRSLLTIDKSILLSIANSIWTEDDFSVKQSFIDILTSYYDAETRSFDIADESVPGKINAWIEDHTEGLIKRMIDKLDENTVMLLINAIYFKGQWSKEFDKSETVQMPFHKLDGNSENVPMMRQKTELHIYEGSGFIIAEFPYGQGNFVMDVILPGEQNASGNIIESLNHENFSFWLDNMNQREADVLFPSFKYGYKKPMKDILTDMGMAIAFSEAADFSNISEQVDLLINEVTHQTFIETNEEGTEAAGVTVVDFNVTSVPPPSLYFKMDHPFIYIIRETTTNAILFAGRVTDPSVN